jgi:hypothetical protein
MRHWTGNVLAGAMMAINASGGDGWSSRKGGRVIGEAGF